LGKQILLLTTSIVFHHLSKRLSTKDSLSNKLNY
jgi:hypothetical protein